MSQRRRGPGVWRRCLRRWTSSQAALDAAELQADARSMGGVPVDECGDRQYVTICGTIQTVTFQPRAGVPTLEVELYDGTGTLTIVWLGRRRIGGIEPGRSLLVGGRVSVRPDRTVMYNPRYELRPTTRSGTPAP